MKGNRIIRITAIVLAVLLGCGAVFGALISALAEASPLTEGVPSQTEAASQANPQALDDSQVRNRYEISMEYLAEEQALRVSQRLVYINRSDDDVDCVVFYAAGNMFRRKSALMYESDDLETVFYAGLTPGGVDIQEVRFNNAPADWGYQGENEMYLRVGCQLPAGEQGVFEFEYYLLLTECAAFQGVGETDVRLSAFYFIPGVYDAQYGEYNVKKPLPFTRWLYTDAADYDVTAILPNNYLPAATGETVLAGSENGKNTWHISAENVREFAISFGKRYRVREQATDSGVKVRVLSNARGGDRRTLDAALNAIAQCEEWFGSYPMDGLDIVQSDYPLDSLNFPGVIWISNDLLKSENAEKLAMEIRFCVAQQYFGLSAYVEPSADAWLSDALCEYIAYLLLEAEEGHDRFLKAINADWVDALQLTIPGGLTVTSDAALFEGDEYELVVKIRGAVVLHELREAMGLEAMLDGLRAFYNNGAEVNVLTEMDLVDALDAVSGKSWEDFLTDWVFNVDEYVNQTIDWFE